MGNLISSTSKPDLTLIDAFYDNFVRMQTEDEESPNKINGEMFTIWETSNEDQREAIDAVLINLCGYSLETILKGESV